LGISRQTIYRKLEGCAARQPSWRADRRYRAGVPARAHEGLAPEGV